MERQAVLWKAVDMVTIARKWSEEVDYQGPDGIRLVLIVMAVAGKLVL